MKIHDTYRIAKNETSGEYYEQPAFFGDTQYNEDIYTESIKSYVDCLDGSEPYFIYYSLWTPHSSIVQPPFIRPDGSAANFSACYQAFPDRTNATCDLYNDTRCVFCKQGINIYISCMPHYI